MRLVILIVALVLSVHAQNVCNQGPPGIRGPPGFNGTSIVGPTGDTGPMGPNGTSITGPTGDQGIPGRNGTDGVSIVGPAGRDGINGTSIIGPTGATGARGEIGPQGIQGDQGIPGYNGTQGPPGETGPMGPQGIPGNDGAPGASAAPGATGPAGADGIEGPTGPAGRDGINGTDGQSIIGPTGPTGAPGQALGVKGIIILDDNYNLSINAEAAYDAGLSLAFYYVKLDTRTTLGSFDLNQNVSRTFILWTQPEAFNVWHIYAAATGNDGATGPIGPTGAQGPIGTQGTQGLVGDTGAQGAQGAIGATGPIGASGAQGLQGIPGNDGLSITGATGAVGAQGAQGPIGTQGAQGLVGDTGAQGAQGAIGATGPTGASGAQGLIGTQGAQGAQGAQGLVGATGAQGAQGTIGAQGTQGATGSIGAQGAQGTIGATGATGTQGAQGPINTLGVYSASINAAYTTSTTILVADLIGGLIQFTAATEGVILTFPTGTAIETAFVAQISPLAIANGYSFNFIFWNASPASVALAAGTGITFKMIWPSNKQPGGSSCQYRIERTAVNTYTVIDMSSSTPLSFTNPTFQYSATINSGGTSSTVLTLTGNIDSSSLTRDENIDQTRLVHNAGTSGQYFYMDGVVTGTTNTVLDNGAGAATFAMVTLKDTTNQFVLGTSNTITLNAPTPTASRIYTLPDAGMDADVLLTPSISDLPITGRTFVQWNLAAASTGLTAMYTVPAGKKALMPGLSIYNPTGGSITYDIEVSHGGVNRQATVGGVLTSAARGTPAYGAVLLPGDILSINANAAGLNVVGSLILVPSTNPINIVYLTLSTTATVFYTCPVGKHAYATSLLTLTYTTPSVVWYNTATSAVTLIMTLTKPSGSPIQIMNAPLTASGSGTVPLGFILEPGDVLTATSTSALAGQYIQMAVLEI